MLGRRVSSNEENLKKIEGHMEEIARLAALCDLSYQDVVEMFHVLMEGE